MLLFLNLIDQADEKLKFQALYDKYNNLLLYISMQKLNNKLFLAEEAVQETWFYIAKNFSKVGEVDSPKTKAFLVTVTQGFAISKYRKESKTFYNFDDEKIENTNFDEMISAFEVTELKSALNILDDESRVLLYLTYVFGYSSNELERIFGISACGIRKKLQFAKKKIRDYYEDGENE